MTLGTGSIVSCVVDFIFPSNADCNIQDFFEKSKFESEIFICMDDGSILISIIIVPE
jgi:hypothetical protein